MLPSLCVGGVGVLGVWLCWVYGGDSQIFSGYKIICRIEFVV